MTIYKSCLNNLHLGTNVKNIQLTLWKYISKIQED